MAIHYQAPETPMIPVNPEDERPISPMRKSASASIQKQTQNELKHIQYEHEGSKIPQKAVTEDTNIAGKSSSMIKQLQDRDKEIALKRREKLASARNKSTVNTSGHAQHSVEKPKRCTSSIKTSKRVEKSSMSSTINQEGLREMHSPKIKHPERFRYMKYNRTDEKEQTRSAYLNSSMNKTHLRRYYNQTDLSAQVEKLAQNANKESQYKEQIERIISKNYDPDHQHRKSDYK